MHTVENRRPHPRWLSPQARARRLQDDIRLEVAMRRIEQMR